MKKLALLGPTLPWRAGVARHTTHVHRELAARGETYTLGLQRQYPALLFPGRFQTEPTYEGYREPGVDYLIDSLNPATWREARERLLAFAPGRVLVPWWTVYWAPVYRAILPALRARGCEIQFLCHHLVEPSSNALRRWLTRTVLDLGTVFTAQAPAEAERLQRWFPSANVQYLPHPAFVGSPPAQAPVARRATTELLFFGLVRRYKGIETLLAALLADPRADVHLTIVGEWWKPVRALRRALERAPLRHPITVVDRFVCENEAANYFALADAVVLPYHEASGSGVVGLAHSYGKPVIVSRVGGLPDQVRDGENGLVVPPRDPAALAQAIRSVTQLPPASPALTPAWTRYVESLIV